MSDYSKKRVLVIDDAALVRTYYRSALEARGFVVEEALNGLEGLEKVLLQAFDLAIVDVNMPQMDGITFLHTLRSKELPISGIPVLVTSTESGMQDMAAARRAGANYYLVKPIKQETLAEYAAIFCGAAR
ncbi:response regulator [Bradyrhizobium sp. JYMT SZCCT0428]|uniref:response regulator n=1 Tax=Bradyrhizobium sp. JYMT SZCCT0428 TaxID=2807673 RepID=UPI001BAB8416|nr:response regulator [Bradyrhizobium sp. JYMT SZCCT0428]MBR1150457.1 response regulator [Bradyrhizobium sp. JYMT SZCCT0428]